ncbi:MAG TPA: hypothetical protein VE954_22615 [Oligoflexus sp.]|uniref:hypothetical protein n=1 Tax=Oligoflexus sp. TaxID=1971216 RepID=UPI002D462BEC|nr:hypothetical protein [Oligoflexus sp.]HYX35903.1 hypothetical protein [Oligoflexus sp.]
MFPRTLVRGFMLWLLSSACAHAGVWLQAGESVMEQGDFLLHPGIQLGLGLDDGTRYRVDFTGRRFGSFLEMTTMLSRDEILKIFPWPELTARYGVTVMDAYTSYDPPGEPKTSVHDVNIGLCLGLAYTLWSEDRWRVNAEWNSQIYAAGFAFLFLTTARKSIFTLGAEVAL